MKDKNSGLDKKFTTWMPVRVFKRLNDFAKNNAMTGLGKFDYSIALSMLLDRADYYELYEALEQRVEELEEYVARILSSKENKQEKNNGTFRN